MALSPNVGLKPCQELGTSRQRARQNGAKPECGIETFHRTRQRVGELHRQNGAKPECGIETMQQNHTCCIALECQNGAKPECGIETVTCRDCGKDLPRVRMALSPNVGLKRS